MRSTIPSRSKIWVLTVFALVLFSCSSSQDESSQDKARNLLTSGVWHVASVTADDVDKTSAFTGLTLTFTATTYAAQQGDPVWASSGTWVFTDENAKSFTRDGDTMVTIQSLTSTHLTLSLISNYPILEVGGRTRSIDGEFVFEFNK